MAWRLRQFFEGDKNITVEDVATTAECWVDESDVYVPNSIAIKVNGTQYLLPTVSLALGFLRVVVPSGVYIGPTTTVQVYAVCETNPDSTTDILTAKPVNFQVNNGVIKACNPQVILNSDLNEYIRFFLTAASGSYFNAKLNGVNLTMSEFSYQAGDTGNIVASSGNFSRPTTDTASASLISNIAYTGTPTLAIAPLSVANYFTTRLGYIELIFDNGTLKYNNYMVASEFEVSAGTYIVGDTLSIEAGNSSYTIKKNGSVIATKNKNVSYTVSGGTISPTSSQIGVPVVWNVPSTAGAYTFTATLGDSVVFSKTVNLHSCADAVNDTFTGTYNTPFSGNVSTNDVACVGENTYFTLIGGSVVGGSVVLNTNGTFTFTPTLNFNGAGTFAYNIQCGSDLGSSEITDSANVTVNYFDACNGVVANWQPNGQVRCQNCSEERQETDLNGQCTGNTTRWVSNPGGSACSTTANLIDTGVTRCQACVNEKEVQDLNPCSGTYEQKFWVVNPTGTNCDSTPSWVDNGSFRCNNCLEEKQQIDTKTCSPTYNATRWVLNAGGTQCNRTPNWSDIGEFICISCVENKVQKDLNPCSPVFDTTRYVVNPGGSACNTETTWIDTNITRCEQGVHQKLQTAVNPCATETERWVNTGLQLCGCIVQTYFTNICAPDNPVSSVTAVKQGTLENRLISFSDNIILFNADTGTATYVITVTYQNGMKSTITRKDYACNPLI